MRKAKVYRIITSLIVMLSMISINTTASAQPNWVQDNIGWWYKSDNGGYARNEWKKIDGSWYYFENSGYIVQNSWKQINGTWYFFKNSGSMAENEWIGQYYVDSNGAWVQHPKAEQQSGVPIAKKGDHTNANVTGTKVNQEADRIVHEANK